MLNLAYLRNLMIQLGVPEERCDAGETAFMARQLEQILSRTFDVKYPELKARKFIPLSNEVNSGAQSYTYRQWDEFGIAAIISNYADNLPMVDAFAKEFTAKVVSLGAAYHYSVQDIRSAAFAQVDLDSRRSMAARRAIETKIDQLAAIGDTSIGTKGFLNATNVPVVAVITGSWSDATTAQQILDDLNKLVNSVINLTKETIIPDTLILDTVSYQVANSKRTSDLDSRSVLKSFLENNEHIKNIDQWHRCSTASAGGGRRIVCYKRDPEVLELVIPQEYEQFPPQAENLKFKIPCHARMGGVSVRYPMGIAYMDITAP